MLYGIVCCTEMASCVVNSAYHVLACCTLMAFNIVNFDWLFLACNSFFHEVINFIAIS